MVPNTYKLRGLALAFAVAALFGAQAASAAPLNLADGDRITLGYGGGANGDPWGGGEFQVSGVPVSAGDPFFTFCVEFNEHFSPGGTYYVKINTGAVNGGLSNAGTYPGDPDGATNFDPLSNATAWLYTQFMTNAGVLGYDMSGTNTQTSSVNQPLNDAFQLAIWKLESELSGSVLTAYNSNTVAQNMANAAISGSSSWTDTGNVRVLNLYDTYNSATGVFSGGHQDQLYMVVPEPASLALLGLGLAGIGFVRRRKQKAG